MEFTWPCHRPELYLSKRNQLRTCCTYGSWISFILMHNSKEDLLIPIDANLLPVDVSIRIMR